MEIRTKEKVVDRKDQDKDALTLARTESKLNTSRRNIASEHDVLQALETEPTLNELSECLQWLRNARGSQGQFNIILPSPRAAKIINILVTDIASNFWNLLNQNANKSLRHSFLSCLRSIPGIAALQLRLRFLANQHKLQNDHPGSSQMQQSVLPLVEDLRQILNQVLEGPETLLQLYSALSAAGSTVTPRQSLWNQAISLLAGGRLLSTLAEIDLLQGSQWSEEVGNSLSTGSVYALWLGRNIRHLNFSSQTHNKEDLIKASASLLARALSLGYSEKLIEQVFGASFNGDSSGHEIDLFLLQTLKPPERQQVLYVVLRLASIPEYRNSRISFVPGFAALLEIWQSNIESLKRVLVDWVCGIDHGRSIADFMVHRSVITSLSRTAGSLTQLCEDIMTSFGDKLYIQNASTSQQDVLTQDLLLIIGHLVKLEPKFVQDFSRSSLYINAISNRIAASSTWPQFLGMVVAIGVSSLTDKADSRVKFKDLAAATGDPEKYLTLLTCYDSIGSLNDLKPQDDSRLSVGDEYNFQSIWNQDSNKILADTKGQMPLKRRALVTEQKNQDVVPVKDSESDSEPEDDPTLALKRKPNRPVYIRDLLTGLRDEENHELRKLCLEAAGDLIRRKTTFGTEVMDHLEELASTLAGARTSFNTENFSKSQLKALISIIIADPETMGRWFAHSAFVGDYSVSQRIMILTALTFAARELAGFKSEDASVLEIEDTQMSLSKSLPATLAHFKEPMDPMIASTDVLAERTQRTMIQPMAASAADQFTGPDALKIRSFSSKVSTRTKGNRVIQNKLSKIVADSMVLPLLDRFKLEVEVRSSASAFFTPMLLAHFFKTTALLIAASGPHTLGLPAVTTNYLTLCLSPRLRAMGLAHAPIMESLLFSIMTIIDVNCEAEKGLVVEHGHEILEIKAWVESALERTPSGANENDRIRVLSAGILVRCTEVMKRYQQDMMGRVAEFI